MAENYERFLEHVRRVLPGVVELHATYPLSDNRRRFELVAETSQRKTSITLDMAMLESPDQFEASIEAMSRSLLESLLQEPPAEP